MDRSPIIQVTDSGHKKMLRWHLMLGRNQRKVSSYGRVVESSLMVKRCLQARKSGSSYNGSTPFSPLPSHRGVIMCNCEWKHDRKELSGIEGCLQTTYSSSGE